MQNIIMYLIKDLIKLDNELNSFDIYSDEFKRKGLELTKVLNHVKDFYGEDTTLNIIELTNIILGHKLIQYIE